MVGLLLGFLWLASIPAWAQDPNARQQTQQELELLRQEIRRYEEALRRAQQAERQALRLLENYNRQIRLRDALLATLARRVRELDAEMAHTQEQIAQIQDRYRGLLEQYRRRAQYAYRYGRLHELALVFTAESFNQALIRARYLRRFAQERRRQAEALRELERLLLEKQRALASQRSASQTLLQDSERERRALLAKLQERDAFVRSLRQDRARIQRELEAKRRYARELERRLAALIAEEQRRSAAEAAASPEAEANLARLSGDFAANRGRLPWPADGFIAERYGRRVHPEYGTQTLNIGIDIATPPAAPVRAVFDGRVTRVLFMADYGNTVLIQHGAYTTVYANLSTVFVQEGELVAAGQIIARAGLEESPRGTGVFFALWHGQRHVDPEPWLAPRRERP
ncbi:MAG: peptidoglycan DD-metalloendopeptidase family protein [Bacteroidetes bacterium]|nr:peptidoglycan DD-metalloendopeptidase family protein [Rhodothermia bacterium]MCS7155016.1 peptidoglycan DD-metalloendopeptidase family protein [Bacteroidota bacterium]MCX7907300.1 peptidoglycan DD-metalloendopeptidase family protein [Bacteroidota bacterium]MDW8137973.1 peptidoglycan DD-metalloendopeptidase family protein [Bacteroidota bacterium]MDW8286175.1 peptidoglycan DD-metalloendopeptidase family protein [Bacteroidota bacterium]